MPGRLMKTRRDFVRALAKLGLQTTDNGVALLWYYRQTQEYDERSPSDLANDLHDEGFPKPNVTRLRSGLRRSKHVVGGRRPGTFQLNVRWIGELDQTYNALIGAKIAEVEGAVLPNDLTAGTRMYLERLSHQINGSYEYGFYDACGVLCRRLMESLIVETYIGANRHSEIQNNGTFIGLERLIVHIKQDRAIPLGRGTADSMEKVKEVGDTAAHDRTYITKQVDIDDLKTKYRKLITELLSLSGIRK